MTILPTDVFLIKRAQKALSSRDRPRFNYDWPCAPKIGDVRLAEPIGATKGEPRIVAVVDVDPNLEFVTVALVSNEVENASSLDVIVPTGETDLPFEILVQTDLLAPLWSVQVGGLLCSLSSELTGALLGAVAGDFNAIQSVHTGPPIAGQADSRWFFKKEELRDLQDLAADCTERLLQGEDVTELFLDPYFLSAESDSSASPGALALVGAGLASEGSTGKAVIRREAIEVLFEEGQFLLDALGPQGDEWDALEMLIEKAYQDQSPPVPSAAASEIQVEPPRTNRLTSSERAFRAMMASLLAEGRHSIQLVTLETGWLSSRQGDALGVIKISNSQGDVAQIVPSRWSAAA